MPEADTLETDAPEEEGEQNDSPPPEENSDAEQNKSQRSSLRSIRKTGKLGKGFGGGAGGGVAGAGATGGVAAGGSAAAGGGTAAAAGGGAAIFGGGWIILIVGIVILLILIIVMVATGGGAGALEQQKNTTNQLKISKTGPTDANIEVNPILDYQINISYPGTAQDIVVTDRIPDGTEFLEASPSANFDIATKTATWNLKDHQASPGAILSNINTTINLKIKATANNSFLVNQASGSVIGAGTQPPGTNNPPNTATDDFNTLMTGQGRNTGILGEKDAFIAAVLKNGAGLADGFSSGSYTPQLGQIYDMSIEKQVNPLIVVTIWGVEAGFELNNTEFGCMPFGNGFSKQLSCSRNTLNNLMIDFEQASDKSSLNQTGCDPYTDPFIFAYEQYTPVCHTSDGNDASRKNFVHFFKTLYGVK